MASQILHKPTGSNQYPHVRGVQAGINKWDPMHKSIFEVVFTLPQALSSTFKNDEYILTEQVTKVDGLDVLNKVPEAGSQKFFGVDVSYSNPVHSNTYADINLTLNLNIRNATDAYVFKVFKAWGKLAYDLADGTRSLKVGYIADNLRIAEANRDGSVWRSYVFHDLILTKCSGLNDLDYSSNDARQLEITFRSDYWDEDID